LNPSTFGQAVLFTATVSSNLSAAPNGETVIFKQGTTVLGTGLLSSGSASLSVSTLGVGTRPVTAVYAGDSTLATSTSTPVSQVIFQGATTTAVGSSQNPSKFGQSVTFTATVLPQFSGTPAGSVKFMYGTTALGSVTLSAGKAKFTTTTLPVGTASVTAVYAGNASFQTSTSAALNQVVSQASTTTTLSSSLNPSTAGTAVSFTATVAGQFGGTVAGSVTFLDGTTMLKTVALSAGTAKFTTITLASGTHGITANYSGNASFTTSSASLTQTVN
jgi:hypothetical protein